MGAGHYYAINVGQNIYVSNLYPEINTRRLYLEHDFLININAGGSTFYTFSLFFFNICFFVFLRSGQKLVRIISLSISIMTAVYIVNYCFKASVVTYFLLSVVLQLTARFSKKIISFSIITVVTSAFILVVITMFEENLIQWIIDNSPTRRLTIRFVTMLDVQHEEAAEGTITGRTNLYLLSVKTWLDNASNFLFGIGDHFVEFNPAATGIGQHAELLDILGRYGLLGFIVIFSMLKGYYQYLLSIFDRRCKTHLIAILVIYIVCGLSKGIFNPPVGCAMFILLPLSAWIVNDKSAKFKQQ